jgi:response regulator RpfG family c-di-GMP phosphodiesterase
MKRNILFIDDETNILQAFKRKFRKENFNIMLTNSPQKALQIIEDEEIALIISDQRMPQISGVDLLEKVLKISPDTIRIILTGYSDVNSTIKAINKGHVFRFLTKPWNDEEILDVIKQAIELYEIKHEKKRLESLIAKQNEQLKVLNKQLDIKVRQRTSEIEKLNSNIKKSFLATIHVLIDITENDNSGIGNHSKRVRELAMELGKMLDLNKTELFELEISSLLHDIGKIYLPNELLHKLPSQFSNKQLKIYQNHVDLSEKILKEIPHIGNVPKIIRHHHEHIDGSGFPDKLLGAKIPICSRIISIVDQYDKYLHLNEHKDESDALTYIKNYSGKYFDKRLVENFEKFLEQKGIKAKASLEIEIFTSDLRPGMQLARPIHTNKGLMLLKKNTKLNKIYIQQILDLEKKEDFPISIYVYSKKTN